MAFLICFSVGFLICIPVGPVNVCVINTCLKKNYYYALVVAGGGAAMDFCYFMVILTGLSFFNVSEIISFWFKAVGITLIFMLCMKNIFVIPKINKKEKLKINKTGTLGYFILGVFLYMSNPTLIVTMSAIGAFIKSLEIYQFNALNVFFSSLGLSLGTFTWFLSLTMIIIKFEEIIKTKYLTFFNIASGGLMILFSAVMLYKLVSYR